MNQADQGRNSPDAFSFVSGDLIRGTATTVVTRGSFDRDRETETAVTEVVRSRLLRRKMGKQRERSQESQE